MEITLSFPTRERGLKCLGVEVSDAAASVVPHEGTWIEISMKLTSGGLSIWRSPRGNVD